ncbi:MAG: hypothetical protein HN348_05725 [Proteobacteria bacterium]|jgi:hypothetical protein|nr:hypothetical protein [Pseudomonadota bacterium]
MGWILFLAAAWATGFETGPQATIWSVDCHRLEVVADPLLISYSSTRGACAGGSRCSESVVALSASKLRVFLDGCDVPLKGRFYLVGGQCDGPPLWQWSGDVVPGRNHYIAVDGGDTTGGFLGSGDKQSDWCPVDSPIKGFSSTPVVTTEVASNKEIHLTEDEFQIEETEAGHHIAWVSGQKMRHWTITDPTATFRSPPMTLEEAREIITSNNRGPNGLSVTWQWLTNREHFESFSKRGVIYCQRALEADYRIVLHPSEVELSGTATLPRTPAAGECPSL